MQSGIPVSERSCGHRWMAVAYIATGLLILPCLILRMRSTPAESAVTTSPTAQTASPQIGSLPVDAGQTVLQPGIVPRVDTQPVNSSSEAQVVTSSDVLPESREPATISAPSTNGSTVTFSTTTASRSNPAPSELIEAPDALSESEFLASLQKTAVEFDLYTGADKRRDRSRDYSKEVNLTRKAALATIQDLHLRLSRPVRLNSGSKALLDAVPGATEEIKADQDRLRARLKEELAQARQYTPLRSWLTQRPDLAGLPISMGDSCRIPDYQARELDRVSQSFLKMRLARARAIRTSRRSPTADELNAEFEQWVEADPESFQQTLQLKHGFPAAVPGLVQIMQGESETVRLLAVQTLSTVSDPVASNAIAGRAIFDPSPAVRSASVEALKEREPAEFRSVLLHGLNYVWPPAAQHAAEALVAVNDQEARSDLLALSAKPDPRAPRKTEAGGWSVHELSSVNHLRNCLLCHAPEVESGARPTGNTPSPGEPLPVAYYSTGLAPVRADVTYLRQDFSVIQEVENSAPWPTKQRFDYFVSKRHLPPSEVRELRGRYASQDYPQRRSVLFALQRLDAQREQRVITARD